MVSNSVIASFLPSSAVLNRPAAPAGARANTSARIKTGSMLMTVHQRGASSLLDHRSHGGGRAAAGGGPLSRPPRRKQTGFLRMGKGCSGRALGAASRRGEEEPDGCARCGQGQSAAMVNCGWKAYAPGKRQQTRWVTRVCTAWGRAGRRHSAEWARQQFGRPSNQALPVLSGYNATLQQVCLSWAHSPLSREEGSCLSGAVAACSCRCRGVIRAAAMEDVMQQADHPLAGRWRYADSFVAHLPRCLQRLPLGCCQLVLVRRGVCPNITGRPACPASRLHHWCVLCKLVSGCMPRISK